MFYNVHGKTVRQAYRISDAEGDELGRVTGGLFTVDHPAPLMRADQTVVFYNFSTKFVYSRVMQSDTICKPKRKPREKALLP